VGDPTCAMWGAASAPAKSRDVFDTFIRIRVYTGSSHRLDGDEPMNIVSLSTHGE